MARQFGNTWWGKAWVDALEGRANLDPNRLPRGRTYARHDHVNRLEAEPGRITALVRGSRVLPYRVTITVRTFDDDQWDRLVDALTSQAAHAAALLNHELLPEVVETARSHDVDLLPGPGDLRPSCSCPDHADPCKHSAAVCYVTADLVDQDPFVLLTLRGRGPEAVMDAIRARRRARPDTSPTDVASGAEGGLLVDPGVPARSAWRPAEPTEEMSPITWPAPPETPGEPAPWASDPPPEAPFTAEGLRLLVTDAAERAWGQLAEGQPSGLLLNTSTDLARRAARRIDRGEPIQDLARSAGVPSTALTAQAARWVHAGPDGFDVDDDGRWRPSPTVLEAGRRAFLDLGIDPREIQVRSNRITVGDVQLRLTGDGRWWRYERRGRTWELVEAPSKDPEDLVSAPPALR